MIKCLAFDCFGTVFKMNNVLPIEIKAYVNHVRQNDFTPFNFGPNWWTIKPHDDSAVGIKRLQEAGFRCVALSNGSQELIQSISYDGGIVWDCIIDLVKHQVYKPHVDAYRTVEKDLGFKPAETLMVTANPTFGDIEGSAAIGMRSVVIRHEGGPRDIIDLVDYVEALNADGEGESK